MKIIVILACLSHDLVNSNGNHDFSTVYTGYTSHFSPAPSVYVSLYTKRDGDPFWNLQN